MSDDYTQKRPSPPPRGRSVLGGRFSRAVSKEWQTTALRMLRALNHDSRYRSRQA